MTRLINPRLLGLAANTVAKQAAARRVKQAVQPPMDPAAAMGGMPPGAPPGMDPAMMGGMPPGAPIDPLMMGGAPPMPPDPSMMGGAPPMPGGGGLTADSIRQIIRDEIAKSSIGTPGGNGPAGPAGPGGQVKPAKPDLGAMQMDLFQTKKMVFKIADTMGIDIPPEIMDGPNRDAQSGMPVVPGTPGSTSDPAAQTMGGGGPPPSAIPPIEPIQPAMPGVEGGGGEKMSGYSVGEPYRGGMRNTLNGNLVGAGRDIMDQATALAMLFRGRK